MPEHTAIEAQNWFERQESMRLEVAERLNKLHLKRDRAENARRIPPKTLEAGIKVWYKPERKGGTDKLDTSWKGPGKVLRRMGADSYIIQIKDGSGKTAHRDQLHPYTPDETGTAPSFPLFYFSGKAPEVVPVVTDDEYIVERVLEHRLEPGKGTEFRLKWEGYGERQTWEPLDALVMEPLKEYLDKYNLTLQLQEQDREVDRAGLGR